MTAPEPSVAPLPGPRPPVAVPTSTTPSPVSTSPVAAAVARLDGVHQLPLHEQPDAFQAAHAELQNALTAIDDA